MSGLNATQWQDTIVDQICERIFVAMGAGDVQSAFNYFDVDGDGNIEYEEFVNALKALEIGLSDEQVGGIFFSLLFLIFDAIYSLLLAATHTHM